MIATGGEAWQMVSPPPFLTGHADEALSEAAVIAYRGYLPENRLQYYNSDSMYLITKGDYFVNWSSGYTVHKYATVSLFMYWLAIHSKNGFEIYKDIANAPEEYKHTYKAILYAANKNIKQFKDWSELYATWLEANYKNETSGLYGYKGIINTSNSSRRFGSVGICHSLF